MERRADRELPEVQSSSRKWLTTLPIFFAIIAGSSLAIFNYQKSSSSTVNSTLYALRTSPQAREILGDEIYFRDRFPWISGELNQLHGRIDIGFGVKGKKGRGYMRFRAFRKTRMGYVSITKEKMKPTISNADQDVANRAFNSSIQRNGV
jgi:cytochrome c oxidase assembly factor 1